jgi:phosphoglycerate dehydrogenase-like enzyme
MASRERSDGRGLIHGIASLYDQLPLHDIVVVSVPLSEQTHKLVDARFLAAMPDGALLVNVARGPVADTDGTVPGVLITPHVGGASSAMLPRMARLVRKQIGLLLAGEEPVNVVLGGNSSGL